MLKKIWNRVISAVSALAVISCISLPQTQVVHAAYAAEKTTAEENTEAISYSEDLSELTSTERNVISFEYEGKDFSVKAEVNTDAAFTLDGSSLRADEVQLLASAIDETDTRYEKMQQAAADSTHALLLYDIDFCTANGEKVDVSECDATVNFYFHQPFISCESDEIQAVHFTKMPLGSDEEDEISFERTEIEITGTSFMNEELTGLSFHVDSFSVYGILFPKGALAAVDGAAGENAAMQIDVGKQQIKTVGEGTDDDGSDSNTNTSSTAVHKIESFKLSLESGAVLNSEGKYVWTPTASNEGHGFTYKIIFSISGDGTLDPGTIQIRIPKQILKDEAGNYAGELYLPYPERDEDYDKDRIDYIYYEDTASDEIIITNVKGVSAGTLEIPVMYVTSEKTWEYEDMGSSVPCVAKMTVESNAGGNPVTLKANTVEIPVYIDTNVEIASTSKSYYDKSETWKDAWGTKPDDADEYMYFVWTVRSTITNVTQKYEYRIEDFFDGLEGDSGEVVGYRMKGESTYTVPNADGSSPTVKGLTDGTRTDYVLTRYPKSAFEEEGVYYLNNSVKATVIPADGKDPATTASGAATYPYDKVIPPPPEYSPPGESYTISKYGIYGDKKHVTNANQISSYALEDLKAGKVLPGLTYHVHATTNAYIRTLADGATGTEEDAIAGNFGKNSVTYSLSDSELYLNSSSEPLHQEDYTFTSLEYTIKMKAVTSYDQDTKKFQTSDVTSYRDDDILTFYVMTEEDGEYVKAATYRLSDGAIWIDDNYISDLTNSFVYFKDGVKGWKMETANPYYSTEFDVYPQITLNATDTVKEAIGDSTRLAVKNTCTLDAVDSKDNPLVSRTASGTDYVAEVQRNSSIAKKFDGAKNYTGLRCYKVNWSTSMKETYTDDSGTFPVRQESGVFYDLIPAGCRVDLSSIQVCADDVELTEGEYIVDSLIENYKDSGRTLLTVRINVPAEVDYKMTYTTVHLWEDIQDYGRYLLNSIAYETGNEDIANGYPDNGGTISDSTLLEDLDPDSDAKRFLYSQATHTINALIPFSSGITKKVASANDASFSDKTIVHQDSDYVYSIRMENSSLTSSRDIVILDSLENFCKNRNGETAGAECDWRGALVSFGFSNLESKGVEPVVYLSRAKNLDLEDYRTENGTHDFVHDPDWVEASSFGDYSEATAFAVDLTKKINGDAFVLGPNESFSFTVNMHSPESVVSDDPTLETYNNVYRSFTSFDPEVEANEGTYHYTHYDHTTVTYRTVGTLHFKKLDSDTNEPIQGIQFNLSGTSDYGTAIDKDIVTNSSGEIYLADLERGKYLLRETNPTSDYLPGADRIVTVDENGNVTISPNDGTTEDEAALPVIENKPRVHGDLSFLKRDALNLNDPVLGAVFTLTGTSDYGNKIVKTATSSGYGVTFEDVELGTYTLTETSAPDDYIAAKSYTVVCDADGILSIRDLSLNASGDYVITDMPRQSFGLHKVDEVSQTDLQDAKFMLQSVTTDSGEVITQTVTSDMFGKVLFKGLDFGTYKLIETKAPKNHALDATEYTVEIQLVNNQPVVTIDGLELEEIEGREYFVFPNVRQNNGTIRIIKNWVDDGSTERPTPVIHLSTNEPEVQHYKATIEKSLFKASFPTTATSIQRDSWSSLEDMATYGASIIGTVDAENEDRQKEVYLYSIGTDYYIWSEAETVYLPDDCMSLFGNLDGSSAICKNLITADLSQLDFSKVEKAFRMFQNCSALTSVVFPSTINTEKLKDMQYMFRSCSSLTTLNLSGFDTASVTTMDGTFYGCSNLQAIRLGEKFSLASAETANQMFMNCSALASLDCSGFGKALQDKKLNANQMFNNCSALTSLTFPDTINLNLTNMCQMFNNCAALTTLDLSGLNTEKVTTMEGTFQNSSKLETIILGNNFSLESVTTTKVMFNGCAALASLDCTKFGNAPNLRTAHQMFNGCKAIEVIDLSNLTTSTLFGLASNGTPDANSMRNMFTGCSTLKDVRFGDGLNTSNISSLYGLFFNCYLLSSVEWGNFSTERVTNMESAFDNAFRDCTDKVVILDLSNFDTHAVTTMRRMFNTCKRLKTIYVSPEKWSTENVVSSDGMFSNCSILEGRNGTKVLSVTNASYACIDAPGTPGYLTDIADKPTSTSTSILSLFTSTANFVQTALPERAVSLAAAEDSASDSDTEDSTEDASTVKTEYVSTTDATWTQEGDTWICEFKVYDDEALYYVWEDPVVGYNSDATISNPKTVNADGNITQLQTITNKQPSAPEPELGSLTLTKNVTKSGTSVTEDTTEFTFQIKLTGDEITGTQYFGTTEFLNGVANVTLTHGKSLTISDIPAGTEYAVKETNVPYGYESKAVVDADGKITGTIINNGTATVEWENAVDVRQTSAFHVSKTVTLSQVTEKLDGTESAPESIALTGEEQNQEFMFTATLSNLDRSGTYNIEKRQTEGQSVIETLSFSSNTLGEAVVTFTLKHGETADFAGIPIDAEYRVTESLVAGYDASYVLTDENGMDKTGADGTSETGIETLDEDEDVTVAFTNAKTVTVKETVKMIQVAVEKKWAGDADALSERPASITVYLERGLKLFSNSDTLYNQETCGTATIIPDDKGVWKVVFTDLPETDNQGRMYVYSVQEDAVAGYACEISSAIVDDASGNQSFTITNTKQPTYDLSISKTVTGAFGNKAKQFEFTVKLTDSNDKPLNGFYTLKRDDSEVQLLFDVNGMAKIGVSHGETAVIKNLPEGTQFTVTETDYSKDGYTTKSALGDAALTEQREVSGTLNSNQVAVYENSRDGILPTGLVSNVIPLVILGVSSLGGIVMLKRRKQFVI